MKLYSLLTTIVMLFLSLQNSAQGLLLGIKAGVNFDRTQGEHLDGNFNGYFLGGAYAGLSFSAFKIQIETLFSQSNIATGSTFHDAFKQYVNTNVTDLKEGSFKMNELSIPLTVGYRLLPKLLWLQAGVQYTGVVSINDVHDYLQESKRVFTSGYLSGVIGAELTLPLNLNAGARYVIGITDRNKTDVPEHWRTNHIQVHVGYSFIK
jgi:hypothetical protein